MVTTQRILVEGVAADLVAEFRRRIDAAGHEAVAAPVSPGECPVVLLCAPEVDPHRIVSTRREHAAGVVFGLPRRPNDVDCRLAMRGGCAAILSPESTGDDLSAAIEAAVERGREARQAREEMRRQEFRAAELRRRCADQAARFQKSQDTFFLDLSRLMTIITNIMDGIVFVDRAGNVTLLNPGAEDLLGTKSFVAIGKSLDVMQGQPELIEALRRDHRRMNVEKEVTQTVEVHHSEQDLLYIQCITSRVQDYRGQPAGVLTVLKDVTAEFKTDQLKNQYLSIVAHELRTPLTGIKTFSTMMSKGVLGGLTEGQQQVCESIREQSLRLEHQIDKLINLGSLESADYGQDREVCSLAAFTNALLVPFEQPSRDRGIALRFDIETDGDGPEEMLFVDRADMRRACQALVENAVKFTADAGTVDVSIARDEEGRMRFRVVDDGIGIDPRYHRRIFEKFFQVEDPLTRHHGGAGLGLFVAQGIVQAHGSRIEVSSQLGEGADFSFIMPVHRPSEASAPQDDAVTHP